MAIKSKSSIRKRELNKNLLYIIGLSTLAIIYFKFGIGALTLNFPLLALASLFATLALALGLRNILLKKSATPIIFWGTLAAFLAHIPITAFEEDEHPIFLIALAITPAIAGITWLAHHKR